MRVIVLLGLCVIGSLGAPVAEQGEQAAAAAVETSETENELRVKRAEEEIMFGNQQNEAREMKKRDDPNIDMATLDKGGSVVVKEPVDFQMPSMPGESVPLSDEDGSNNVENENDVVLTDEQTETASENEEEEEEEDEEAIINETPNGTDIETIDEIADEEESDDEEDVADVDYQEYMKALQNDQDYLSQYYKLLSGYQNSQMGNDPYLGYYPYANLRYRRSQTRKFNGANLPPLARAVKRSHRTKRDLIYPYYDPEYLPLDDGYFNRPYENYPLESLLDALKWEAYADEDEDDDDDVMNYGYGTYAPFDVVMDEEDEDPWYEAPPKRQAGLTYFPGIKRSRDFYPYFQEPGTHFQAFVPQKRSPTLQEYTDAYEKVMELAAALREQNYYPREYELEYKK